MSPESLRIMTTDELLDLAARVGVGLMVNERLLVAIRNRELTPEQVGRLKAIEEATPFPNPRPKEKTVSHSYDRYRACHACGDMDGCHVPGKVKRHRELRTLNYSADGGCGDQPCQVKFVPFGKTMATEARYGQAFPKVVCLCGSTRFMEAFLKAQYDETLEGNIVLSVGCNSKSDAELFAGPRGQLVKEMLDELHKRKIDHADEVLVLNVGGYVGESTRSEIEYARATGKPVRYLEPNPESA